MREWGWSLLGLEIAAVLDAQVVDQGRFGEPGPSGEEGVDTRVAAAEAGAADVDDG